MNNRSDNVDLSKFIGALLIMAHHLYIIDINNYRFSNGWIYVEFFLVITGYYTTKHFEGKFYDNCIKQGIIYTVKKFIPFLPYTFL